MKRYLVTAAIVALSAVGACTAQQASTAQGYQDQIAGACTVAMTLAPIAGPVAPWIIGGCATEQAVAKLALDPSSLAWINGLVAKARGV